MRQHGKIAKWNDERGFGFITAAEARDSLFVHVSAFPRSDRRPNVNEAVSYTVGFDSHGRPQANDVQFIVGRNGGSPRQALRPNVVLPIAFTTSFLIALVPLVVIGWLEITWLVLYYGASIITYISYSRDKKAAENAARRTRELSLHLMSLVGGWPGALIAQVLLRHKTRKPSFLVGYWLTVIVNCAALVVIVGEEVSPISGLLDNTI